MSIPRYLGGSVFVQCNGHQVEVYTGNGLGHQNKIYLEQETCDALVRYLEEVKELKKQAKKPNE